MLLRRRELFLSTPIISCYNYRKLLCWYSGHESTVLRDTSKYHCTTSIAGSSVTLNQTNHCYTFDGQSGLVFTQPRLASLLSTTQSLAFWFKCTDSNRRILFSNVTCYPYNMELTTGTSSIQFRYYIDGDHFVPTTSMSFNYNTWYHLVIAHVSMSNVSFYVNGSFKYTLTEATAFSTTVDNSFRWGCDVRFYPHTESAVCFGGYMADMRVYNYTLSASEASTIYNEQSKIFTKI